MIEFLNLVGHFLVLPFKTQARLEAEIILLRHQLNALRRQVSAKPKLTVAVCLGEERHNHHPARHCTAVASVGLSLVLALEVAPPWRSAKNTSGDPSPDPGHEPGQPAVGRPTHPW
jgi:hypothetical protein